MTLAISLNAAALALLMFESLTVVSQSTCNERRFKSVWRQSLQFRTSRRTRLLYGLSRAYSWLIARRKHGWALISRDNRRRESASRVGTTWSRTTLTHSTSSHFLNEKRSRRIRPLCHLLALLLKLTNQSRAYRGRMPIGWMRSDIIGAKINTCIVWTEE